MSQLRGSKFGGRVTEKKKHMSIFSKINSYILVSKNSDLILAIVSQLERSGNWNDSAKYFFRCHNFAFSRM